MKNAVLIISLIMCFFCVLAQRNSTTDTSVVNQKYKGMENILKTNLPHHQQERNSSDNKEVPIRIYSGAPGINTNIRICTPSRANMMSPPLFIVNYGNKVYKTLNIEKDGVFKMINPHDISEINIPKDLEAIKKYGDDGKNGVVIITIKEEKAADFAKL